MKIVPHLLSLALIITSSCTNPQATPVATFDNFLESIEHRYGGFEAHGIDWSATKAEYEDRADDSMSDDELYDLMCEVVALFDDGHMSLMAPDQADCKSNRHYREKIGFELFDLDLIRDDYLDGDFETNSWEEHSLGTLADGSAYIHLAATTDNLPILADVRPMAEASDGLILDLRHNGGGQFTYAYEALAQWRSERALIHEVRTRTGPEVDAFSPWFEWWLEGTGSDIDFPMVVLIDRFTISAGERMLLALDLFDNVRFMGDMSNGAFATTTGVQLLNGWNLVLPSQDLRMPDGSTPEGTGFEPDIFIENDPAVLATGIDEVLEAAMLELDAMR